jgi:hypothetical protein
LWFVGVDVGTDIHDNFHFMFYNQELLATPDFIIGGNMFLRALWQATSLYNEQNVRIKGNISYGSVDDAFGTLARSMTAFIRTHGAEGVSGYAKGDVWLTTTCVHVRWEWITFPAIMLFLTGLFLVFIILDNWGTPSERLWKSSLLASLFGVVDIGSNAPDGKTEMVELAKSTSVTLGGKSGGLRLVAQ